MTTDDWRLHGQERYLTGARVQRVEYRAPSVAWDHDHCELCNRKFSEGDPGTEVARAGWRTEDAYRWICDECFADLRETLRLVVLDGASPRGVELHDATIVAITERAGVLTIELDAFVHDDRQSNSCVGRWQTVALAFYEATSELRGAQGEGAVLSDGAVRVNQRAYENMLPFPFHEEGAIVATFVGAGFELSARAQRVWMRLAGG